MGGCTHPIASAPGPETAVLDAKDKPKEIDIYLDFTKSMQGFLAGAEPPYGRLLEIVERAASSQFGHSPNTFKFGKIVEPLIDRDSRFRPSAYNSDQKGYEDNDFKVVVDAASPENLSVVVSDLFQADQDINKVTDALLDKYQSSPRMEPAVGVSGYRLRFNGQIYDVGHARANLPYDGPSRPVYVVAFGRRDWVESYVDSLNSLSGEIGGLDKSKSIRPESQVWSPSLVRRLPTLELMPCKSNPRPGEECFSVREMDGVDGLMSGSRSPLARQYRIRSGVKKAAFTLAVRLDPDPLIPELPETIRARAIVHRAAQRDRKPILEDGSEIHYAFPNPTVRGFDPHAEGPRQIVVEGEINADRLAPDVVYRYEIVAGPEARDVQMPRWIKQWSFTAADKPDGTKTLNLEPFFFTLWNGMSNQRAPELLHVYLYLKRE
jgi:hypothetical protein